MTEPLLRVEDLRKYYFQNDSLYDRLLGRERTSVKAVDGVSFDIYPGETLGLVGESGCGKSTTGETLLRLREPTEGEAVFDGENVFEKSSLTDFRRNAQIVFQDPFSSLDPRMTAGRIVREPLDVHGVGTPEERQSRVRELMERVGLSAGQVDRYPHEFSGGQRQRIGIARALALEPEFIVLDEPVSALDVSVQAQILNLLKDLQQDLGLTYLFIAHDLSVVRHISDRVAVMYLGEIAEIGTTERIFEAPDHPYTEALLESVPRASTTEHDRDVDVLEGDVPSPRNPPSGCRFRTRCPEVIPPEDVAIEQEAFREVMDLRDRLEAGGLGESIHQAATERANERNLDRIDAVEAELFDREIAGENSRAVREALERVVEEDDVEAATERLRERFESVCERVDPELVGEEQAVACHLYEQPAAPPEAQSD